MRKRLRKKVSKYRCLKCGSRSGIRQLDEKGRVKGRLYCMYCDMEMPRELTNEMIEQSYRSVFTNPTVMEA